MSAKLVVEVVCDNFTLHREDCRRSQQAVATVDIDQGIVNIDVEVPLGWGCSPNNSITSRFFCPEHDPSRKKR